MAIKNKYNRRPGIRYVAFVAVVLANTLPPTASATRFPNVVAPKAMVALGDSLTSGFPGTGSASWATGTASSSHATRLKKLYPRLAVFNFAQPGAPVASFASQARDAVKKKDVGYVVVLFGGNDVCNPSSGIAVPVETFRQRFAQGLQILKSGMPTAKILVVSIPNLAVMQQAMLGAGRPGTSQYCARFFENPTSNDAADVSRRGKVMSEIKFFNYVMAKECAKVAGCKTDSMAVYKHQWKSSEISSDGIHPTSTGQRMLAEITWAVGVKWTKRS